MSGMGEPVLKHHGVKGMKWGVRKRPSSVSSEVSVRESRARDGQVKLKGSGGNRGAHEDAIAAVTVRQVVRTSGTHAVSNKELKVLVDRMNLEQQYSRLNQNKKQKTKGAKFASEILGNVAKQQASRVVNDAVTKQVAKALSKS